MATEAAQSGDYREVRVPKRTLPAATASGWPPRRSTGCMWHSDHEAVTVLLFPDTADATRALLTLTPDAAECLADDLRRCAAWTRDYAAGRLSAEAKVRARATKPRSWRA